MKRNLANIAWAFCGLAVLTTACCKKAVVDVELEGLADGPVYVHYAPVTDLSAVVDDTLSAKNGKFSFRPEIGEIPVEVRIEPASDLRTDRRGRLSVPMSHRIRFWMQPNERVRLRGRYEAGYLNYMLRGTQDLEAQATLRESVKEALREYSLMAKRVDSLYGLGVENLDEAYVDSLYVELSARMEKIHAAEQQFIRTHAGHLYAGLYLLEQQTADDFLELEALLAEDVREGLLKERIAAAKAYFERRKQLEANAAALVQDAIAPDFTLTDIHGKPVTLSAYAKRYVVLDFWGTWCPWCIKGMPEMKRYYEKYSRKATFIGIACRDRLDKVQALVKTEKLPWISVMNGEGDNDVSFLYGVSAYPTKIILKPGLKVEKVVLGEDPVFYETLDALMR
ncbi:MAG: TlpA family protein disulfide reductase [Bacteroidales bacterium]|nr:TlpA family protein disulfide reductase [Bacteroidales bacterium]